MFASGVLDPLDVLSFALASKTMYGMVLGENAYDRDQHRALAGVGVCCRKRWWRAACLAVKRGLGDPTEEWEDKQVSTYAQSKYGERVCIEVSVRDRHNSLSWAAKHGRVDLVSELLSRPDLYSLSTPSFVQLEDAIAFAKQAEHWDVVRVLGEDPRVDVSLCGPDWEPLVQMSGE